MKVKTPAPPVSAADTADKSSEPALGQIDQNIETILAFYTREEKKMSGSQRVLETASSFAAQPLFLGCILLLVRALDTRQRRRAPIGFCRV